MLEKARLYLIFYLYFLYSLLYSLEENIESKLIIQLIENIAYRISFFLLSFVFYYINRYNFYQQFHFYHFSKIKIKKVFERDKIEKNKEKNISLISFNGAFFIYTSTAWPGQYPAGPFFVLMTHTAEPQKGCEPYHKKTIYLNLI